MRVITKNSKEIVRKADNLSAFCYYINMNNQSEAYNWYQALIKPTWAPPSFLFGPVWTALYAVIIATFGYVFYASYILKKIPYQVTIPFILNIIFNIAFTPLQFWLRNNVLASIDILLILATLIWALLAIYPYARSVAYANIPYLLWVIFATCLQLAITYLNMK